MEVTVWSKLSEKIVAGNSLEFRFIRHKKDYKTAKEPRTNGKCDNVDYATCYKVVSEKPYPVRKFLEIFFALLFENTVSKCIILLPWLQPSETRGTKRA